MVKDKVIDINLKKWILGYQGKNDIERRIFCFPYAGCGASIFRGWNHLFDKQTEICPIQYPGRENRFKEKLQRDIRMLVSEISDVIDILTDYPYFFFGHSLGGIIAYDLCHYLSEMNIKLPEAIFISASRPPHLGPLIPKYHELPYDEFIEIVRVYGGTSERIFEDESFMELYLPILKNDFAMLSNYKEPNNKQLNIPIIVLGGKQDPIIYTEELELWKDKSTKKISIQIFDGDHFFINAIPEKVTEYIKCQIKNLLHG